MSDSADLSSVFPAQSTAVGGGGGQGETSEGTPAAGDQVGDSGVQEGSNDTGDAVASSSSGEGVPVKHPAAVYSSPAGIELQVPDATVAAVDNFQVSSGFVRKGSRMDSYMYSLGVYVEQVSSHATGAAWTPTG